LKRLLRYFKKILSPDISNTAKKQYKFKTGQEITPTYQGIYWEGMGSGSGYSYGVQSGPDFGEIVTVTDHTMYDSNGWRITITKYDGHFAERDFSPVISTKELSELLNEAFEPTKK